MKKSNSDGILSGLERGNIHRGGPSPGGWVWSLLGD